MTLDELRKLVLYRHELVEEALRRERVVSRCPSHGMIKRIQYFK